mgnify:CR=1 FL=1
MKKIYVYAICKNEEQFVDRWVNSVSEADGIYVLDTGSTDNTVKKLKDRGVNVKVKEIKPWRFDVARNESMKLIPKDADICVCLDMDEIILPGWRKKLEEIWDEDTTRLKYNYIWSFDKNGKPGINFYIEKIHILDGYKWIHPVHEVLTRENKQEVYKQTDEITVEHYPDETKSRSNYLPLLEMSVEEDPEDDRNMHYLGREYMYNSRWNDAIDTLIKHLSLKKATWKDERSASMRYIARCYKSLGRIDEARMWLSKAIIETPYLREPLVELSFLEYEEKNYKSVIMCCESALNIKNSSKTYINEPSSWDHTIYDLLSIAYFEEGEYEKSLEAINKAIEISPDIERLQENKQIIEEKIKSV